MNRRAFAAALGSLVVIAPVFAAQAHAAEGDLSYVTCYEDTGGPAATCTDLGGSINGLDGDEEIAVSPDDDHVYVASAGDDSIAAFARNRTTGALQFIEFEDDGVAGVEGLIGANAITVAPDGRHVYAVSVFDDAIVTFARNPSTGELDFAGCLEDTGGPTTCPSTGGVDGLDGPSDVVVSPDGRSIYVISDNDNAVASFNRNPTTGALTFVEFDADGAGGVDGLDGAEGARVSPDGKHVYVVSSVDSSIAAFSRNPATGGLTFVEFEDDGVAGVDGIAGANEVVVSPDGRHVYSASRIDSSIAAFSRNPATGALQFVEFEDDGAGGVDGLLNASGVAITADGKHVYGVGFGDDAMAAFSRNPTTGALAFLEFEDDGVNDPGDPGGTVDGLDGANALETSPDGTSVYVSAGLADSVALFAREPDLAVPETTIVSGPAPSTTDNTPSFGFTSDDLLFARFECRVDDGPFAGCASPYTAFALAEGPHRVEVRALDTAGNVDQTPAVSSFSVNTPLAADTTAPDTELTAEPPAKLRARKKRAKARFEFAASEPGATFECRLDAAAFAPCASPRDLKLKKGVHTFRVRAVDAAGNADFSAAKWQGSVVKRAKKG